MSGRGRAPPGARGSPVPRWLVAAAPGIRAVARAAAVAVMAAVARVAAVAVEAAVARVVAVALVATAGVAGIETTAAVSGVIVVVPGRGKVRAVAGVVTGARVVARLRRLPLRLAGISRPAVPATRSPGGGTGGLRQRIERATRVLVDRAGPADGAAVVRVTVGRG